MLRIDETPVISIEDVLEACDRLCHADNNPDARTHYIEFASELTGLSEDKIINELKNC